MSSPRVDGVDTIDLRKYTVAYLADNYLARGFFLSYCCANHNEENISFYIAIQQYRELFRGEEHLWPPAADRCPSVNYDLIAMWPSPVLSKRIVDATIQKIQDQYLSMTAPLQISMSGATRYRVTQKMSLPSLYGGTVFDEALSEPIRCLRTLIIPLFLRSQQFAELQEYEKLLSCPPTEMEVALPHVYFQSTDPSTVTLPELTWSDIYRNYDLYSSFYDFMIQRSSSQMLLCRQMIRAYRQCFEREIVDIAESRRLYRTTVTAFIVPGSCYDIRCDAHTRNEILFGAALPEKDAFEEVMSFVAVEVESEFNRFMSVRYPLVRKGGGLFRVSCSCIEVMTKREITKNKSKVKRRDTAFPGAIVLPGPANQKSSFLSWWRRRSSTVADSAAADGNLRQHSICSVPPGRKNHPTSVARMIKGLGMEM